MLWLRQILFGLLFGALLSLLRAPLGLDITQLPAAEGATRAFFRAAPLFACAFLLDERRLLLARGVPWGWWLPAITLGFALHGLFAPTLWLPGSRLGYGATLLAATGLLWLVLGRGRARAESPPTDAPGDSGDGWNETPPTFLERMGWSLAAAGATLAIESCAHQVRLFGLGESASDTVAGGVLLVLIWIGLFAFGLPLARRATGPAPLALGLVASAVTSGVGLVFLNGLTNDHFFRYLGRFGLDFQRVGAWQVTALVAGGAFAGLGFAIGFALQNARHPARAASLFLGAAIGLVLYPQWIGARTIELPGLVAATTPFLWISVAGGVVLSAAGVALAAIASGRGAGRFSGVFVGALALALCFFLPRIGLVPLSPWYATPVQPDLVWHTPAGLVTLEVERLGNRIVTLDRRRLTPSALEDEWDADELRFALQLARHRLKPDQPLRVLFVGQLTAGRARVLEQSGVASVDRSAAWWPAMATLEELLVGDLTLAEGEILAPVEARRRLADGRYDLVLAPSTQGPVLAPRSAAALPWAPPPPAKLGGWSAPEATTLVGWVRADADLADRPLPAGVLLAGDAYERLSIGAVENGPPAEAGLPIAVATGARQPAPAPWRRLQTYSNEWSRANRKHLAARLERANEGTAAGALGRGLARYFEAQKRSSPYETLAQQIEVPDQALQAFFDAARDTAPDPFLRSWWNGLARVLVEKRAVSRALVHLEPLADAYAPWPELERAVARAYQEFGMAREAAGFLARALESNPHDIGLLSETADWTLRGGDPAAAADLLRRAVELQPGRYDLERALAIALIRAGDPIGSQKASALLQDHPGDEELARYLEPGPLPELSTEFEPASTFPDDH